MSPARSLVRADFPFTPLVFTLPLFLLAVTTSDCLARDRGPIPLSAASTEMPSPQWAPLRAEADTVDFGSVDSEGFAVLDEAWTWDHGGADPWEGWTDIDATAQIETYGRQITDSSWLDGDNAVAAPILDGAGSLWIGAFEAEASSLCWEGGLGYGNHWCQNVASPALTYAGSGDVTLSFTYFNDTELDFDYTYVVLRTLPDGIESSLNGIGFTDQDGLAPTHPDDPPVGTQFEYVLSEPDFGGNTEFQLLFRMTSDGGWADEDGAFTTEYGPFAADDISLTGTVGGDLLYEFETDLEGWTPSACPGIGSYVAIADRGIYDILDPCACELAGNVLGLHDENFEHPSGQNARAVSNPVDIASDVAPILSGPGDIVTLADWDQYLDMPYANGVFYRPGWDYYPWTCEQTGAVSWSGRVGMGNYMYGGDDPFCARLRNVATENGIPHSAEQIRFIFEVYSSCDAFGIPPEECSNVTNATPLVDNVRIRFTRRVHAPSINFDVGLQYQDGYSQSLTLDPYAPGRADVTRNVNFGNNPPFILGDSLLVQGPLATSGLEWEAKLWFRLPRVGPRASQSSNFTNWIAEYEGMAGHAITGENARFAWGYMDSFQLGTQVARNKFQSYLREDMPNYDAGQGEFGDANEIIKDNVLLPGTAVEYFVTAAYVVTPSTYFVLPDTTGGHFAEFEILPRWRDDGGTLKYPCVLYIDASTGSSGGDFRSPVRPLIEDALETLGIEHDRYDYLDATSNWKAPMRRGSETSSNNGFPAPQIMGYRSIILTTGAISAPAMWPEDFIALSDWLTAAYCSGNQHRQGLILNGDGIGSILDAYGGAFFHEELAATLVDPSYRDFKADENYCVRLDVPPVGGELYGTENSSGDYAYGAFGNGCPSRLDFDVIQATPGGVGNRAYIRIDEFEVAHYSQVVHDQFDEYGKYRSVVDAVSYHHLVDGEPEVDCTADPEGALIATRNELASAFEWVFGSGLGELPGLCTDACVYTVEVDPFGNSASQARTALYGNEPNPFNPRTTLRFYLAQASTAALDVFDSSGRRVRSLLSARLEAGPHEAVWDGSDDQGRTLSSGVYWSRLTVDGQSLNRKMVLLK